MGFTSRNHRRLIIYAGVFILVLGTIHLLHGGSAHVPLLAATSLTRSYRTDSCALLAGIEDVFVIIRTGSNELRQKLPPLLKTTVPCFQHYGIWSDLKEEFSGYHIADALDEINPELLKHHSDFEYYRYLQENGRETAASGELASWTDAPNTNFGRDTPAWKLDKWKFLPAARKAYRESPTSKWYIFLECDTYIFWNTLLTYLSALDPSKPYYIGRQMNIATELFAYGGAGIVISNAAMAKLVERYTTYIDGYDKLSISQWAGDYILSKAMLDAGVELSQVWPTLEGEMPSTLNLKSTSTRGRVLWCYYAASYHHMTPDDIYTYYKFDQKWFSTVGPPPPISLPPSTVRGNYTR